VRVETAGVPAGVPVGRALVQSVELNARFVMNPGDRRLEGRVAAPLPEREHVRLGAVLEEGDLQRPLADRVVLAHELIQPAVPEQAVAVLVDVHAV
jgi:hypothetical protein